jgi:hypothetical protein
MKVLLGFLALFALCIQSASAIDQGTAQGTLAVNGETIALTYSTAPLHDNAETAPLLYFRKSSGPLLFVKACYGSRVIKGIGF